MENAKKTKIKALPPALREKTRYISFVITAGKKASFEEFLGKYQKCFLSLFGEIEYAKANPRVMRDRFDEETQKGIIRVERSYVDSARASLAAITELNCESASAKSIITSGSIRKAKESIQRR